MSLYSEYVKEDRDENVIENENGFIAYRIFDKNSDGIKESMITEFYVKKEYRGTPIAFNLAQTVAQISKEKGCTHLSCLVQVEAGKVERATYKTKLYIHYGFEITNAINGQIVMAKKL